jgi:hypothetical protein
VIKSLSLGKSIPECKWYTITDLGRWPFALIEAVLEVDNAFLEGKEEADVHDCVLLLLTLTGTNATFTPREPKYTTDDGGQREYCFVSISGISSLNVS